MPRIHDISPDTKQARDFPLEQVDSWSTLFCEQLTFTQLVKLWHTGLSLQAEKSLSDFLSFCKTAAPLTKEYNLSLSLI